MMMMMMMMTVMMMMMIVSEKRRGGLKRVALINYPTNLGPGHREHNVLKGGGSEFFLILQKLMN